MTWFNFILDIPVSGPEAFTTLRPSQNGRHFADAIFKRIISTENVSISLKISLKFVSKVQINKIPALIQIMAWRWPGDKPLSAPMVGVRMYVSLGLNELRWVAPNSFPTIPKIS